MKLLNGFPSNPNLREFKKKKFKKENNLELMVINFKNEKIDSFQKPIFYIGELLFKLNPSENKSAIFILSAPRSGSTLLRAMLAGNPQLFSSSRISIIIFSVIEGKE